MTAMHAHTDAPANTRHDEDDRAAIILAGAIQAAAVDAGIVRADASLTGPQLVMLCGDLAGAARRGAEMATELQHWLDGRPQAVRVFDTSGKVNLAATLALATYSAELEQVNAAEPLGAEELAQIIREIDGRHCLGAGELAEALLKRVNIHRPGVQG